MTTMAVAERTYTPQEFLELPDSVGYELVDGRLEERHVSESSSGVAARIVYLLQVETERTNEFRVYGADLAYQCFPNRPKTIRRPDASLILKSRLAGLGDPGVMPIAADLVVEVLSPNDLAYQIERKIDFYLSAGFGLVWVVNPELKTVSVHRADGSVTRLHEGDEITGETALPGFRRRVGEFFER